MAPRHGALHGRPVIALLALLACDTPAPDSCATTSWDQVGRPFVDTWCTPCHSGTLPLAERQGAPVDVNYDELASVIAAADRIRARISGDAPSMPPGGGVPRGSRDAFVDWLDCGAPGSSTPVSDPCDTPRSVAQLEACTGAVRVDGPLTVERDQDVSCVCEVTGDLDVQHDTEWTRLTRVGGALRVAGDAEDVRFPRLAEAGSIDLDAPGLTALTLDRLRRVGGEVAVNRSATPRLPLDQVVSIGGDLAVRGAAGVQQLALDRLESIGGELRVVDLPDLRTVTGTHGLTTVGGAVTLAQLPSLARVDGFSVLASIGGPLTIVETGIAQLRGFDRLVRVRGLEIRSNRELVLLDGAADLVHVDGSLILHDNDALHSVDSLVFVRTVAGDLTVTDHELLDEWLPASGLELVRGDVRVTDNPGLWSSDVQAAVSNVEVEGVVTIERNRAAD